MSFEQLMQHARDIERKAYEERLKLVKGEDWKNETGYERDYYGRRFADIPGLFQPFADMPTPESFDPLIDGMNRALYALSWGPGQKDLFTPKIYRANPALDKMKGVERAVAKWTGGAAENFVANFVDPFSSIERNQFMIATVLKSALDAQRAIWTSARIDIDGIAEKTLVALDKFQECGKNDWTITFTVIASVAAVGAVVVTGGTATVVLTAVGAVSQVVAAKAPDGPKTAYSGESPEAVISCMREAITKLTQEIHNQELKISNALKQWHDFVSWHRKDFVSPRPDLAGATAGTVTSLDYMNFST